MDPAAERKSEVMDLSQLPRAPLELFRRWFAEADNPGEADRTAMALATAGADGRPSVRMVLVKGFDERGFNFYTNFGSRKGAELRENPRAALVFHWASIGKQVRIEGRVERVPDAEADEYFNGRPLESRIGAWTSDQSREIPDREALEQRRREIEARFPDGKVPRPPFWGGYRVVPERMEFWLDRPGRLHDRFLYERQADGGWRIARLAP